MGDQTASASTPVALLADRLAIQDCLVRYCRGIDRLDEDLVRSAYWEDSTDDHGAYKGNGHEFASWAVPRLGAAYALTHHSILNSHVELDGDVAHAETYVHAYHLHHPEPDGTRRVFLFFGRYVDVLTKRDGEWRIADRVVVYDWSRIDPIGEDVPEEWKARFVTGRRDRTDPSYRP